MNITRDTAGARIIVALDVESTAAALALTEKLRPAVNFFKVGLQLFTTEGPAVVRELVSAGARVFLDLKLHDIPNTVAHAVKSVAALGAEMLTLHLSGGAAMINAAVEAAPPELLILGVTVLTSSDEATLRETGIDSTPSEQVERLARLGHSSGLRGFVASPHEIARLRELTNASTRLVIPGIRPAWADAADQKRIMTPREAIMAGADYLVIGRPITAADEPAEALDRIINEISGNGFPV